MRSILLALFTLAVSTSVLANPDPEPQPEPNRVIHPPVCGGWTLGSCAHGLVCVKGQNKKYSCQKPAPLPCQSTTPGFCPAGKVCQKTGLVYKCAFPGPVPSGKLKASKRDPFADPEPEPYHRARCGGKTLGFCPSGSSCIRGRYGYSCKAGSPAPRPVGPSPSARHPKRSAFCEKDAVACPVRQGGFECIEIRTNIEQCGDCAVLGGVDCSAIPGVAEVACVNGYCRVDSCTAGYVYDFRKRSCIPNAFWNVQA